MDCPDGLSSVEALALLMENNDVSSNGEDARKYVEDQFKDINRWLQTIHEEQVRQGQQGARHDVHIETLFRDDERMNKELVAQGKRLQTLTAQASSMQGRWSLFVLILPAVVTIILTMAAAYLVLPSVVRAAVPSVPATDGR